MKREFILAFILFSFFILMSCTSTDTRGAFSDPIIKKYDVEKNAPEKKEKLKENNTETPAFKPSYGVSNVFYDGNIPVKGTFSTLKATLLINYTNETLKIELTNKPDNRDIEQLKLRIIYPEESLVFLHSYGNLRSNRNILENTGSNSYLGSGSTVSWTVFFKKKSYFKNHIRVIIEGIIRGERFLTEYYIST